jgi:microcystin-dependent protein
MRKAILAALVAWLLPAAAMAANCASYPNTLTNNTIADANQVMGNFNAILNCANNNLAPLANPTFTGTVTLTTPLAPSSGGSTVFVGGTSTGSANAQVVATLTPTSFALQSGNIVIWKAGFTNTGPLTLNANNTGATNVEKMGTAGATPLIGQEIQAGATYAAIYDGAEFVLLMPTTDPSVAIPPGVCVDYAGSTAPTGWVFANSQVVGSTGSTANLFAVLGTTFGAAGTTPDYRGRAAFGVDNMGGIGAAGRLGGNSSVGGISGTASLGASGGQQSHVQTVAELATHNHGASGLTASSSSSFSGSVANIAVSFPGSGAGLASAGSPEMALGTASVSGSVSTSTSIGGATANAGSSAAANITPPAIVMNKICKL